VTGVTVVCEDDRRNALVEWGKQPREMARAIKPEIKCVIFECDGCELILDGRATFEGIDGSGTLVNSIGRIVLQND
jgi:hypothetical protein